MPRQYDEGKIKDWSSFVVPLVAGFIKEEKTISRQFLISSRKGTSKNVPDFLMSFSTLGMYTTENQKWKRNEESKQSSTKQIKVSVESAG